MNDIIVVENLIFHLLFQVFDTETSASFFNVLHSKTSQFSGEMSDWLHRDVGKSECLSTSIKVKIHIFTSKEINIIISLNTKFSGKNFDVDGITVFVNVGP